MTVFANAMLLNVTGPGGLDRNGDPDTNGPVLWEGRIAAYLKRVRGTGTTTQRASFSQVPVQEQDKRSDTLTVLDAAGAGAVLAAAGPVWEGATVTIEDQRTVPVSVRSFSVSGMEHRQAGLSVDSVRLDLGAEVA